jgi:preprotein translocase subunit YajC
MQQYSQYFFIIAIIAVFYFLIIRPQKKRQKDQAELMGNLVAGAEIMTIGGLYGTIISIDDDRVRIEVADGSEMVFAKSAIARVLPQTVDDVDDVDDADGNADAQLEEAVTDDSALEAADTPVVEPETASDTKPESTDV